MINVMTFPKLPPQVIDELVEKYAEHYRRYEGIETKEDYAAQAAADLGRPRLKKQIIQKIENLYANH